LNYAELFHHWKIQQNEYFADEGSDEFEEGDASIALQLVILCRRTLEHPRPGYWPTEAILQG
jgi:hypothetical protein